VTIKLAVLGLNILFALPFCPGLSEVIDQIGNIDAPYTPANSKNCNFVNHAALRVSLQVLHNKQRKR
jgi:hypothetical protein